MTINIKPLFLPRESIDLNGLLILLILCCLLLPNFALATGDKVRVGVFNNRPIVFETTPGNYSGLSIDVIESIAEQEGWQLDYVFAPWKGLLDKLDAGELDLIVGIAYNEERATRYDYTQQTLINNWGTLSRHPEQNITSLSDLQGKKVALTKGAIHSNAFIQIMDDFNFNFEVIEVQHYKDGMQAVQAGKADAAVINRVISLLHAADYQLQETGIIFNPVEVRFAALKGTSTDVLTAIDKHLSQQKKDNNSIYHQSLNRWLHEKTSKLPTWLPLAIAVSLAILLLLIFSNFLIRKQVASRTLELSESELRFRQLADNIKEIFWIGSPDWQQIYYVSPTFETVWQMKRDELYDNPMLWLESVHPEDRDVVAADVHKKSNGDLEEAAFPEYRIVTKSGIRWILARAFPIHDEDGNILRIVGIAEDITDRKLAYETIDFMAHHDPLTRLHNRFAFENKLTNIIEHSDWQSEAHALLYIDLDQFKIVNDTCGHAAGDRMLIDLTQLLLRVVGDKGLLARLGGDEFGLIIHNTTLDYARMLSEQLLTSIQKFRFEWDAKRFSVGASIGLVMIRDAERSQYELLSAADMACYAAKESGRNRLHLYTHDDAQLLERHGEMQWVNRIKEAIEDNRFVLYKQSIKPLQRSNQHELCNEYLFRMLDEDGDLIMPGAFIPAAERFELMPLLDRWVVRNVIVYLSTNPQHLNTTAFINLSGQIFNDDDFINFIVRQTKQHNIDPQNICLEITETAAISNLDKAISFINQLRDHGFKFALDDFGSGMSSFSYLKFLPVDYLKIDGVFIKDLMEGPINLAIVNAITEIGHTANLKVIAEWVENAEMLEKLIDMKIDFAQGFAIDRPASITGTEYKIASSN